jgi:hypothetical protein
MRCAGTVGVNIVSGRGWRPPRVSRKHFAVQVLQQRKVEQPVDRRSGCPSGAHAREGFLSLSPTGLRFRRHSRLDHTQQTKTVRRGNLLIRGKVCFNSSSHNAQRSFCAAELAVFPRPTRPKQAAFRVERSEKTTRVPQYAAAAAAGRRRGHCLARLGGGGSRRAVSQSPRPRRVRPRVDHPSRAPRKSSGVQP